MIVDKCEWQCECRPNQRGSLEGLRTAITVFRFRGSCAFLTRRAEGMRALGSERREGLLEVVANEVVVWLLNSGLGW